MGCQKTIAKDIIENEADYILAVKGNQAMLLEDIIGECQVAKPTQKYTQSDIGHGRIETRTCTCLTGLDFIRDADKWKDLTSIIKVDSVREFKNSDKLTECSTRYYISSLDGSAEDFAKCIRSHWGIENSLHWTLDVAFGEDASRKRLKNASQNFSILNKIALNLLKNEKTNKSGVKGKRLKAGWDNHYLIKALNLMKF